MTNEMTMQELMICWQDHTVDIKQPSIDDVRSHATKFQRRIRIWNAAVYASGAISLATYGRLLLMPSSLVHSIGMTLILAATAVGLYQVRKGRGARSVPEALGRNACLEFHRAEIARQRNFLLRSWRYLLLPIPGFVVLSFDAADRSPWMTPYQRAMLPAILVILFVSVTLARRRQANQLQRELDSLASAKTE